MYLSNRKLISSVGVLLIVFGLGMVWHKYSYVDSIKIALADDDYEEDDRRASVIDTAPTNNNSQKTETKTTYTKLSDTVSTETTTVTKHDSDGDGIYDEEDPHPTINENFIVKDNNLNGIDDRYEQ